MPSYVITGGRGLALEFSKQLSSDPSNTVIALVRDPSVAVELRGLAEKAKNLHILKADLKDISSLYKAAEEASAITGGKLDVLLNVAAWMKAGPSSFFTLTGYDGKDDLLLSDLHNAFDTNVVGAIFVVKAFLPLLRAGETKKVVLITSGMGHQGLAAEWGITQSVPYAISKAAVNMVNAKYAADLADEGFIFVALCPGLVDTSDPLSPMKPTPEMIEGIQRSVGQWKKAYPDWDGRPITPTESVNALMSIINTLKPEENGAYMSHFRNQKFM